MLFVVPGLEAPVSGGNRYNTALIEELVAIRIELAALDAYPLEQLRGAVWVDSLYLTQLPRIRARVTGSLGLLAHSLPSLLARAEGRPDEMLDEHERALLALLDRAVAPSETMRDWLLARAPSLRVAVAQPAHRALPSNRSGEPLRALMVANLLPNKGVLPFLNALAPKLRDDDRFVLRVIGRVDLDRAYAASCLAFTEPRIAFADGMQYEPLLAEYARAHVLVSASRSESYGMALAEARASGGIVLAHAGGHAAKLHDPASGTLAANDDQLADALLSLVRDPCERARRTELAEAARLQPRSWRDVAHDFLRA